MFTPLELLVQVRLILLNCWSKDKFPNNSYCNRTHLTITRIACPNKLAYLSNICPNKAIPRIDFYPGKSDCSNDLPSKPTM